MQVKMELLMVHFMNWVMYIFCRLVHQVAFWIICQIRKDFLSVHWNTWYDLCNIMVLKLVSQETMLTFSYSPIDSVHCNCYIHGYACVLTCIGKMFMHLGLFLASIMLHEMHVSFLHILISWMKYTESRSIQKHNYVTNILSKAK
jgi:hypothetical protein